MQLSLEELDEIAEKWGDSEAISPVYREIRARYPDVSGNEVKELFLWCIRELMTQGRLKFLGENAFRSGPEPDAPWMFGDGPDKPTDIVIDGLTQPQDPSPEGITNLIRSKWPPEVEAYSLKNREGFDTLWFEKWDFDWFDKEGNPVYF